MIEAVDIHKDNNIRLVENGATVQILKNGLYDFDADRNQVRVFDGEAAVRVGNHEVKLKGHLDLIHFLHLTNSNPCCTFTA